MNGGDGRGGDAFFTGFVRTIYLSYFEAILGTQIVIDVSVRRSIEGQDYEPKRPILFNGTNVLDNPSTIVIEVPPGTQHGDLLDVTSVDPRSGSNTTIAQVSVDVQIPDPKDLKRKEIALLLRLRRLKER